MDRYTTLNGTTWIMLHPRMKPEMLGYLPGFLHTNDPRGAREQFNACYVAGWDPFGGFTMDKDGTLTYPGDPPMKPLAKAQFRDEVIYFYDYAWVAVVQKDGTHEICRMD